MLTSERSRLAVWGDPIEHSRSPQLHAAAYRVLGFDWSYELRRVSAAEFPGALGGLDGSWRGLSLTMPLKTTAFEAARTRGRRARLTGAVNTLLLGPDGPHGFNTDVGGLVAALGDEGISSAAAARIVGAGATATSALVALSELGVREVQVVARRPEAAAHLVDLGASMGIAVSASPFEALDAHDVEVTISTVPGDAVIAHSTADALAAHGGLLLDVVYGHWPTVLASAWGRAGGRATSGLGMLLHQALLQVRIFAGGAPDVPLRDEQAVLAAMRDAVVGD
jgi:shikimate dehydrogenase